MVRKLMVDRSSCHRRRCLCSSFKYLVWWSDCSDVEDLPVSVAMEPRGLSGDRMIEEMSGGGSVCCWSESSDSLMSFD